MSEVDAPAPAPPMTDEAIASYLGITKSVRRDQILRGLTPERRKAIEELALVELAVKMYLRGEGPKPPGVILCGRKH